MDKKYTVDEVAKELKVNVRTILREIQRGKLNREMVGRRYLISEKDLNLYLGKSTKGIDEVLALFLKNKKSEMVTMLQKLVSMPSVSSELGQEEKLAKYIKKILDSWGIRSVVYKEGESVAVRASYGYADKGFLLDSPLDTLPPGDVKKWSYPPFDGVVVNGRMYGRGTSDAKAGIVTQLYTLLFFKRYIDEDKIRVEVVFDGGEQDGEFLGMKQVLGRGLQVNCGLIGYGGDQRELMFGARGYHRYEISISGKAVHTGSRYKEGLNAISKMAELIGGMEKEVLPKSKNKLFSFGSRLTFSYISGGRAINMVPDNCITRIDVRTIPDMKKKDVDNLIEKRTGLLRKKNRGLGISVKYLTGQEAYSMSEGDTLIKSLDYAVGKSLKRDLKHTASGPAHVGNLLIEFGISTAVWGPKGENPHSYDEYIEINSLTKTVEVYVCTIAKYFDIDNSAVVDNLPNSYDVYDWS